MAGTLRPERLWLLSIALQQRGHRRLATLVRNVNSTLYHNSLPPGASVSPDIALGHHGLGIVVHPNVTIGRRVKIWHNVTIATRAEAKSPYRVVIEDDVKIGANSVIISPRRADLRIGRGARIGAGSVVSRDVPPGSTVISAPVQVLAPGEPSDERDLLSDRDAPPVVEAGANGSSGVAQTSAAPRAPVPPRKAEPLA
jgi:serine O-acetyltransferase